MKKTEIAVKRMITIVLVGTLLLGTELSGVFAEDVPAGEPDITESEESVEEDTEPEGAEPDSGAAGPEESEPEPEPEEQVVDEPVSETERNVSEQHGSDIEAETSGYDNVIGGVIWLDENEDGIIDPAEAVISDFPVRLYRDDQLIAVTETAADGSYQFENLNPGEYTVRIQTEIIDETEYLIPLCGISGDNMFRMTELEDESVVALSDPVSVSAETRMEEINAGMRLPVGIVATADETYEVSIDTVGTVGVYNDLQKAVDDCPDNTPCTITVTRNDTLSAYVEIPEAKQITLTSSEDGPWTITQTDTTTSTVASEAARHFYVQGSLSLDNIILSGTGKTASDTYNGGVYVSGSSAELTMENDAAIIQCSNNSGGGVCVTGSGTFEMTGGEVSRNKATFGGGVYVTGSGSTFEMTGGEVSGNKAAYGGVYVGIGSTFKMADGEVSGNEDGNLGGGVYVSSSTFEMTGGEVSGNEASSNGGGVYVSNSTFEMTGGEVSRNKAAYGGGVYVTVSGTGSGSTFEMTGGEVSGTGGEVSGTGGEVSRNEAGSNGGGVYVTGSGSTFEMTGEEVSGTGGEVSKNEAVGLGGGVYVTGSGSTFKMADGEVSGNKANTGGGVYVNYSNTFEMTGGEVSKNEAGSVGGGVYVSNSSMFEMMGGEVSGNEAGSNGGGVYVSGSNTFEMTGGEVSGNEAGSNGGGVYVVESGGSTFKMVDGEVSGNEAGRNGGGVYVGGSNTFEMTGGEVSKNEASSNGGGSGGGVYLVSSSSLDIQEGEITNNSAYASGGGIYTGDCQYGNPDPATSYTNITIDLGVVFSGNTSTRPCDPPANYASFTRFDGLLLNDNDINYQGYYTIYFYANNDTSESHKQETTTWTGSTDVTLDAYSGMGFTAPDGYGFAGWNTAPDGSGDSYTDKQQYVTLRESLTLYAVWERVVSYTVSVEYYYLADDGSPVYMSDTRSSVTEGGTVTIDLTSTYITKSGYTAWYYTVSPDHDKKYYFEDAGDEYGGIDADTTIRVYAVSTMVDVALPGDSFFWYANEDTSTIVDYLIDPVTGQVTSLNGKDVVYEIRSKAYSIENNGLTPVTVELKGYVQDGSNREIEKLLDNSTSDRLFLNLTGDLAEDSTGLDLLQQDVTSDPFGTYTEPLGAGESWQYSFGGFYYPDAGHLPGTSAVSDYKLTFSLAPDLSDPDL